MTTEIKMWRYRLTGTDADPFEWAEVILCSTGFFGAVTDYGNYAFAWRPPFGGSTGDDFRHFVARIGPDYAHSKFSQGDGKVYDEDKSIKHVRDLICKARRSHRITREQARDAWNEIDDDYERLRLEFDYNNWAFNSDGANLLWEFFDTETVAFRMKAEPQCWAFSTKILPRLQAAINEELAKEKAEREAESGAPAPAVAAVVPVGQVP